MANAPFLLESKFNFMLQQTFRLPPLRSFPTKSSCCNNNSFKLNNPSYKVIGNYPKLRTKCFITTHIPKGNNGIDGSGGWEENDSKAVAISSGRDEMLRTSIKNVLKALRKPLITGVVLGLLLLYDHHRSCVALAAPIGVGTLVKYAFGVQLYIVFHLFIFLLLFSIPIILPVILYLLILRTQKISVLKLQVGLLGTDKSLQEDLNRIAQKCDPSWPHELEGFMSYVLQETTLSLLRHPECCISGYSSVYIKRSKEDVENRFNQLCIEERGKFEVETLVNVNNIRELLPFKENIRALHATTERSTHFRNEYNVITIIVGAKGGHTLPPINSRADLNVALQKLACIPSGKVEALAVLLTPQNERDTLTERKFLENYSLLVPL